MKRSFSRYRLALLAISLASCSLFAEQIWRGTSTCDVVDENLVIKDDVLLPLGGLRIEAIHKDVTVTLTRDVVMSGHWAGESDLYLVAAEGRTIRFELDHDITFTGSSAITGDDLLIIQSGPGTVEMALKDGKTFELTSKNCSGGANYYVLMYGGVNAPRDEYCDEYQAPCCNDEYAAGGLFNCDEYGDEYCSPGSGCNENSASRPTLNFTTLMDESNRASIKNKRIVIGARSRMSFLSSRRTGIGQDSGIIQFDPATSNLSRMVLEIHDTGAFIAAGRYTCQRDGGCITCENIRHTTTAGDRAIWRVVNSQGSDFTSGLLVLDKNETLSELLVDPFLNLDARQDLATFRGSFFGRQYGAVVGANGALEIETDSYLDFVALALNQIPCMAMRNACPISKILKMRNPSALFIDGNLNPQAKNAEIMFGERAALFLRSGVGEDGIIRDEYDMDPFTVDATNITHGVGNIVFDVEGKLDVRGTRGDCDCINSKIELLSLEVFPTGGSVFVGSGEANFPLRTFNTEDNELLAYNSGAFLINNQMTLYDTALVHSDESHTICPNNDLRSEPAYIGGETFKLLGSDVRPSIRFINAQLNVNADIALTGLDLVVPNFVDEESNALRANNSNFTFFAGGPCVDNGTGRQMILGTRIGSTAADGCSRIDADAHLDIMQQQDATISEIDPANPNGDQTLDLLSAMNDDTMNSAVVDTEGTSIHTIFLGNTSNISIGTNADSTGFAIDTHPWLRIAGNVFAFAGHNAVATRSMTSGNNAIFVDLNGKFSIEPGFIASICVMVIKSRNGIVDLPADQVFFCEGAGIATWDINLANPDDQIIVGPDQALSTFIFNWLLAHRDCPNFTPFNCCGSCVCPAVTEANVTGLPTVQGEVDNLQIQGTRIGDPAEFLVDGGFVRQISFLPTQCVAEAPVAVVALRNGGRLGLDSSTTLGLNGVTVIADGSGQVIVNDDLIINNNCAIVRGPNFQACDILELYSSTEREIRVKANGTLNLSSFTDVTDIVSIGGGLKLVMEPGSTLITGAGTLRFAGNAQLLFEPATNAQNLFSSIPHGAHDETLPITTVDAAQVHNILSSLTNFGEGLHNTDDFRVKLVGSGTIELVDNAQASIPFNAFVGVETLSTPTCEIATTDLTINLADNALFSLGQLNVNEGGVLQIGNVEDTQGHTVNFTLTIDGEDARFLIGSRGFFGLGVGIERFDAQPALLALRARTCPANFIPNENIVDNLSNVGEITFNFFSGLFQHDRIFSGDEVNASLLAVGNNDGATFNINFAVQNANIDPTLSRQSDFNLAGGGNVVLVEEGNGGIHPVVLNQNGVLSDRLTVGIMASTLLQPANVDQAGLTGAEFFDYITTHDAVLDQDRVNTLSRANVATQGDSFRPGFDAARIDAVINGAIVRGPLFDVIGQGDADSNRNNAVETAAVFINIDPVLNEILTASNIENQ